MDKPALSLTAHAKVNLALHVTGQREDGYHLIDSLVAFTDFGDQISAQPAETNSFELCGPFAKKLDGDLNDNLIIKARDTLAHFANETGHKTTPVSLTCEKNLPVASGLGGGSADAAATLNILIQLWGLDISDADLSRIALDLGADVPMCLKSQPLIAKGIGEDITLVSLFPKSYVVLVNPMVGVSTPVIFKALKTKQNGLLNSPSKIGNFDQLLKVIDQNRNDLQTPAIDHCPEIANCLDILLKTNPVCARMSGSGASCFAVYEDETKALNSAQTIATLQPDWFVQSTHLLGRE
ncbi:MAG: 4-(cytidine 5'-diphospho)-2-C-methyl-D-erythritol kinase [Lentilitoribacter sp.]